MIPYLLLFKSVIHYIIITCIIIIIIIINKIALKQQFLNDLKLQYDIFIIYELFHYSINFYY